MGPERIHIAEPSPPYCASCFQAKPTETHVDFGATYDGPVMPGLGDIAQAPDEACVTYHTIDDLIVCSTCIADAAKLIGLEDAGKLRRELKRQRQVNDDLHTRLAAQDAKIDALEKVKEADAALEALVPRRQVSRRPRAKATA
jgi:hypothetical protein